MTEKDAIDRLLSSDNLANQGKIVPYFRGGRGKDGEKRGSANLPDSLKITIGALAVASGNKSEVARTFGLDPDHVIDFTAGRKDVRQGDKVVNVYDEKMKSAIEGKASEISDVAEDKLLKFLGIVEPANAEGLSEREKVKIARDMSQIVKNVRPEQAMTVNQNAQVIVFSANPKSEKDYEVMTVPNLQR